MSISSAPDSYFTFPQVRGKLAAAAARLPADSLSAALAQRGLSIAGSPRARAMRLAWSLLPSTSSEVRQ